MKDFWFRRKTYGWGWTPANIKGWAVVIVFFFIIIGIPVYWLSLGTFDVVPYVALVVFMNILLILLCWFKGEKPKWQWGNKDKHD